MLEIHVTHEYNYGPWAIVQEVDDEYVRLSGIDKKGNIGYQAFLAWIPKLSPFLHKPDKNSPLQEMPFTAEQSTSLKALRADLASGKKRVVSTHILKAWVQPFAKPAADALRSLHLTGMSVINAAHR